MFSIEAFPVGGRGGGLSILNLLTAGILKSEPTVTDSSADTLLLGRKCKKHTQTNNFISFNYKILSFLALFLCFMPGSKVSAKLSVSENRVFKIRPVKQFTFETPPTRYLNM